VGKTYGGKIDGRVAFARVCVGFAGVGLKALVENTRTEGKDRMVENKKCRGYGRYLCYS
jgi:hypothetical protein